MVLHPPLEHILVLSTRPLVMWCNTSLPASQCGKQNGVREAVNFLVK